MIFLKGVSDTWLAASRLAEWIIESGKQRTFSFLLACLIAANPDVNL
jgi:hypothetical protein